MRLGKRARWEALGKAPNNFFPCLGWCATRGQPNSHQPSRLSSPCPFSPELREFGPRRRTSKRFVPDTCRFRVASTHRPLRALHFAHANLISCRASCRARNSPRRFPNQSAADNRCGFPVRTPQQTLVIMSAYYEPSQWPPSGQSGWDHQTPPPARSGQ